MSLLTVEHVHKKPYYTIFSVYNINIWTYTVMNIMNDGLIINVLIHNMFNTDPHYIQHSCRGCSESAWNREAEAPVKPPSNTTAGLSNGNAILSLAVVKMPHHNALLIFSTTVYSAGGRTHARTRTQCSLRFPPNNKCKPISRSKWTEVKGEMPGESSVQFPATETGNVNTNQVR